MALARRIAAAIPSRDLKHALTKPPRVQSTPGADVDPDDVGDLMQRIEVYDAKKGGLVRYALKLIALTMVRPGELRAGGVVRIRRAETDMADPRREDEDAH